MAKQINLTIGDERIPSNWHVSILARAFDSKELKKIWEAYKAARFRDGYAAKPPTDVQKKMAEMRKKGIRTSEIARQYKVPTHVVDVAVRKVAIWQYLHA